MKSLVLGGSGFIGSHVVDALVLAGHEVSVLDLKPPRTGDVNHYQGSTLDRKLLKRALVGQDYIFNFAGIAHLDVGLHKPIETVEQNVMATVLSLEEARQTSTVKRYVYASSIYVYSEGGSFYRCSKQAAELYVEEFQRRHGLPYTILRYGTVYGPRADHHNSVRKYLNQALKDRVIVARGTGQEVREYVHVQDAARLSVKILEDEFKNQVIVLTGHNSLRFAELLEMIREIVGPDVTVTWEPFDDHDPRCGTSGHYTMTPYHFRPRVARKLVNNPYLDLGQGLLECLHELNEEGAG